MKMSAFLKKETKTHTRIAQKHAWSSDACSSIRKGHVRFMKMCNIAILFIYCLRGLVLMISNIKVAPIAKNAIALWAVCNCNTFYFYQMTNLQ